jgi:hypothetical protein
MQPHIKTRTVLAKQKSNSAPDSQLFSHRWSLHSRRSFRKRKVRKQVEFVAAHFRHAVVSGSQHCVMAFKTADDFIIPVGLIFWVVEKDGKV